MFRTIRVFVVTTLTVALISLSCGDAFAGEGDSLPAGTIWNSAVAMLPSTSRGVMKQTVASTNESKFLLGSLAGAAIVAGVALAAYGATSSCKGAHGASTCDRNAVIGAIALSGGTATLFIWALSK